MKHFFVGSFLAGVLIFQATPISAKTLVGSEQHPVMVKGMHLDDRAEKMEFMHGMMRAVPPSMVATPDGGVIVFVGGKLKKFDRDLNLVKEVVVDPGLPMPCPMMKESGHLDVQKKDMSGNLKNHKK